LTSFLGSYTRFVISAPASSPAEVALDTRLRRPPGTPVSGQPPLDGAEPDPEALGRGALAEFARLNEGNAFVCTSSWPRAADLDDLT
jgi:hypothetical protein